MEKTTLIIGDGTCAQRIAENLLFKGIDVILASHDPRFEYSVSPGAEDQHSGSLEILTATEVLDCQGFVGQFEVLFQCPEEKIQRNTAIIIIAVDYELESNLARYGLKPCDYVLPLSRVQDSAFRQQHFHDHDARGKKIVFLTGLVEESNPAVQKNIMATALELQSNFDVQTYLFTRNLKVAGNGLEALSRDLKKAGAVITKFTDTLPRMQQNKNGGVEITYLDEVTLENFRLNPDLTVVDETIYPSHHLHRLANVFALETDHIGFLQTANTRRIPVHTNRMGILAAGPSKAAQGNADNIIDADAAALTAMEMLAGSFPETPHSAEIDSGSCVRCLTCLRLCPHHAISFDTELWVSREACQGCGLCAAECPAVAIGQHNLRNDLITKIRLKRSKQSDPAVPSIVAFCCSRSAARAADLARCLGYVLPAGLLIVEVPCASSVSMEDILTAFAHRAEGVLVISCHEGNCYSEIGTVFARNRVNQIMLFLKHTRTSQGRIEMHTLAANMGKEFSDIANRWEKQLTDMGPIQP